MVRWMMIAAVLGTGCSFAGLLGDADPDANGPNPDAQRLDARPADAAPCSAPFVASVHGCHQATGLVLDWDAARPLCLGMSADLAIVTTLAESDYVRTLSGITEPDRVWIAIDGRVSYTMWVDGSGIGFTNWLFGQPDINECGAIRPDGLWVDRPCSLPYAVLCER